MAAPRDHDFSSVFTFDFEAQAAWFGPFAAPDPSAAPAPSQSVNAIGGEGPGAPQGHPQREVVIIDAGVADYRTLIAGIDPSVEVIILQPGGDRVAALAEALASLGGPVDRLHLVSHGGAGWLQLGDVRLGRDQLGDHAEALAAIGASIANGGDVVLYGCSVAAGQAGAEFLSDLDRALGDVDIAASDDRTGPARLGGDWALEYRDGEVDLVLPFSVQGMQYMDHCLGCTKSTLYNSAFYYGIYGSNGNTSDGTEGGWKGYTIIDPAGSLKLAVIPTVWQPGTQTFSTSGTVYQWKVGTSPPTHNTWVDFASFNSTSGQCGVVAPTVTDGNISITSTPSGLASTYKIGDTITAKWDNTATGDNNAGITGVTFNFSQFGGLVSVAGTNNSGIWTASHAVTSGSIDMTGLKVSVTATNGTPTTTQDSTNVSIDAIAPTITAARITHTGATGTGSAYKIGDTVSVSWNNTAAGDNNTDAISSVTMDLSAFGGGSAVSATNASGVWTATYTVVAGGIGNGTNLNVIVTVTDDAGNTKTVTDTDNKSLDNVAPTLAFTTPTDNATGVAIGANSVITLSENVAAGTGDFKLYKASDNSVVETLAANAGNITYSGASATINWTNDLAYSTEYYVKVDTGAIVDARGNSFAGITSTTAFSFTTAAPPGPTVTDAKIAITSTGTGTSGVYKVGDTVSAKWDASAAGDNQTGLTAVKMDFSQFGAGSLVTATEASGIWTASYVITSGTIDATGRNVSVQATNAGGTTTTADTTGLSVDNQALTVSAARITLSASSYKIGDTVTATWNNTAGGDNNADTIASVTMNLSAFGGGSAVTATNSSGNWAASFVVAAGAIDATNLNATVTATDNAGNITTTSGTGNATLDNIAPVVTAGNITVTGGTATGGGFKIGDVVTAKWTDTGGDNNTDTISTVTANFADFGGGTAVSATKAGGIWTATYTIVAGSIGNGANLNVKMTATDNAGNPTTTTDDTNSSLDNLAPTKVSSAPADDATGVLIGANTVLTMSETVAAGTGNIVLYKSDNSVIETLAANSSRITYATNTVTIDWTADLLYETVYYVKVDAGAIVDAKGNSFAGITTTTDLSFKTENTPPGPTVTDAKISVTGTASGTAGTYKTGDTITAIWNNSTGGDNQPGVTQVKVDFSQFGGGGDVAATLDAGTGTWSASYTLVAGTIDATNRNVSITAHNATGKTTTADTTNLSVDVQAPTVSVGKLALTGATGTGGAYKIGDTITFAWDNTGIGDNNADIASATVNLSAFGGGTAVALTNTANSWGVTLTVTAGTIEATNLNPTITVTDNAGYTKTVTGTNNAKLDAKAPALSASTPANNGTVGLSDSLSLTFAEAVVKASGTIELRLKADDSLVEAVDVTSAKVAITGSTVMVDWTNDLTEDTQYYVKIAGTAFKDASGNSFAGITTNTALVFTADTPTSGGIPVASYQDDDIGSLSGKILHDGIEVTTVVTGGLSTVTIPVVSVDRKEALGDTFYADIPLLTESKQTIAFVGVPTGIGLTVTGDTTSDQNGLIPAIRAVTGDPAQAQDQMDMTGVGGGFLTEIGAATNLLVRTFVPTGTAGSTAMKISSVDDAGQRQQAFVLDTRGVVGTLAVSWELVEFGAIVGAAKLTGGSGPQNVVADGASQILILGAGNDTLRAGDGRDVVGSAAGNDLLFGQGGYDRMFGGAGNDSLDGGSGADVVRLGLSFADAQVLVGTRAGFAPPELTVTDTRTGSAEGSDRLVGIELLRFTDGVMLNSVPTAPLQRIEEATYLSRFPDVAAAVRAGEFSSAMDHYARHGEREGRGDVFTVDEAFYRAQNPDVDRGIASGAFTSAADHFVRFGRTEGRDASALFDTVWYLERNADVAAAVRAGATTAADHYSVFGWREMRDPSPWFDTSAYLAERADVRMIGINPLTHYLDFGAREGRLAPADDSGMFG